MITNIRKNVSTTSHRKDCASEPEGIGPDVRDISQGATQHGGRRDCTGTLRDPVEADSPQREVAGQPGTRGSPPG